MKDSLGMLFLKEKQARLLLHLAREGREWNLSGLSKEADVTYVHTSRFVSKCEEEGIVSVERHGRIKMLVLTEKGRDLASSIAKIMDGVGAEREISGKAEKKAQ